LRIRIGLGLPRGEVLPVRTQSTARVGLTRRRKRPRFFSGANIDERKRLIGYVHGLVRPGGLARLGLLEPFRWVHEILNAEYKWPAARCMDEKLFAGRRPNGVGVVDRVDWRITLAAPKQPRLSRHFRVGHGNRIVG